MTINLLMIVKTAQRRYAVRRDELIDVRMAQPGDILHESGFELGPLLDPADRSTLQRHRALIVPLRRRSVALLVDQIETFLEHADSQPLPALLHTRLRQPWAVGALALDDGLVVQLDLRAVARSALASLSNQGREKAI